MGNANAKNALSYTPKRANEPDKGDDLDRPPQIVLQPPEPATFKTLNALPEFLLAEDTESVVNGEKPGICPTVPSYSPETEKADLVSDGASPSDISAPEPANSADAQLNTSPPIPADIIPVTFETCPEIIKSEPLVVPAIFQPTSRIEAKNSRAKSPTLKKVIKMSQRGRSFDLGKSSIQSPRVSSPQSSQIASPKALTPGLSPSSESRGLEITVANRNSLVSDMTEEEVSRIKTFLAMFRSPVVHGILSDEPEPENVSPQSATVRSTTDLAPISSPILAVKEAASTMKDGVAWIKVAEPSLDLVHNGITAAIPPLACVSMTSTSRVTETRGPRMTSPLHDTTNAIIEELLTIDRANKGTSSKSKAEEITPSVEPVSTPLQPYSTQNSIHPRGLSTYTVPECDTIPQLTASPDVTVMALAIKVSQADTSVSIPAPASPSVAEIPIKTQDFLPLLSFSNICLISNESASLSSEIAPVNYNQGSGNNGTHYGDVITPFKIHSEEGIPHTAIPIDSFLDNGGHLPFVTPVDLPENLRITSTPPAPEYADSNTSITVNVYPDPEDFVPPQEALSMIPSNGCNSTFCLDTLDRRGDLEQPNLLDLSFPGNASNLTMNLFSSNSAIAMKGFFKSTPPQDIQIVDALPHKMLEDCPIHVTAPKSRGELQDSIIFEPTSVLIAEMRSHHAHHFKPKQAQTLQHEKSPLAAAEISNDHNRKEIDFESVTVVEIDASARVANVSMPVKPSSPSHCASEIVHFDTSLETDLFTIKSSQMPEHTADRPNWAMAPDDSSSSLRMKAENDPSFDKQSNDRGGRRQRNSKRKNEGGSSSANNPRRKRNGNSQERDKRSRNTRVDPEPQLRDRQLAAVNLLLTQRKKSPTASRSATAFADAVPARVYPPALVSLPDQALLNVPSKLASISDLELSPVQEEWRLPLNSGPLRAFSKSAETECAQHPVNLQIGKILVNGAAYEQTNQVLNQSDGARYDCVAYLSNTGQQSADRLLGNRRERHCIPQIGGFGLQSETYGLHKQLPPFYRNDVSVTAQRFTAANSEALPHSQDPAFHVRLTENCVSNLPSSVPLLQKNPSLVPIASPSPSEEVKFHARAKDASALSYGKIKAIRSQTLESMGDTTLFAKDILPGNRHGEEPATLTGRYSAIGQGSIVPAPNNCVDLGSLHIDDTKPRTALLSDTPIPTKSRDSWQSPSGIPVSSAYLKNRTPKGEHRPPITFNEQHISSQPQPSAVDWPPSNSHWPGIDNCSPVSTRAVFHGIEPHTIYVTPQPLSLPTRQPASSPGGSIVTANLGLSSAPNLRGPSVAQTLGTEVFHLNTTPQRPVIDAGIPNTPCFAFNFHQQTPGAISVPPASVAHVDKLRSGGFQFEGNPRVDNHGSEFSQPTSSTNLKPYTAARPSQTDSNVFGNLTRTCPNSQTHDPLRSGVQADRNTR